MYKEYIGEICENHDGSILFMILDYQYDYKLMAFYFVELCLKDGEIYKIYNDVYLKQQKFSQWEYDDYDIIWLNFERDIIKRIIT